MASVFLCLKFTSLNKGKNWSVKSVVSLTQDFQLFLKNFNRGKMNSIYLFINISRTIMCSSKSCKIHLLMSFNLINRLYFCIISFQFFFFWRATPQSLWDFSSLGPMVAKVQSPNQWTDRLIPHGN